MTPVTAYVALGANLEDPVAQVKAGIAALATLPRTQLVAQSSLYRTAPVGYADQPDFINAVAAVDTALSPRELLDALLAIELDHGRVRKFANAPRTLDLDMLLYGNQQVHETGLTIPHPRMHERAFVLAPLAEIAPQGVIPGHGSVKSCCEESIWTASRVSRQQTPYERRPNPAGGRRMTPLPEKYRYIVVEGPIGAGKTSLARLLAEKSGSAPLLEDPGSNPFLPGFYSDQARYALPTQLFFLFQRIQQVRDLSQADLFRRATVADFILDKDPLFARLTLNDDELGLYQQIYAQMKPQAAAPDLVIYLQASTETLIERVKRRAINYERAISEDYLMRLAESYARFFYQYDAAPVLIVNSEHLNFVDTPADFDLLLQRIAAMRGAREFFSLGE